MLLQWLCLHYSLPGSLSVESAQRVPLVVLVPVLILVPVQLVRLL